MIKHLMISLFIMLPLAIAGCGGGGSDSPTAMFDAARDAAVKNDPVLIWNTLPSKWQADADGLVHEIGKKVPAQLYDKVMATAGMAFNIMKTKEEFVWNTPMAKMQMKSIQERARSSDFGDEAPAESWKTVAAFFGVPVEFDANPLSRVPWLTWSLLAVIAGFSISAFSTLDTVIVQYGLIPVEAWRSGGVTFLSSFFLHGGWIHLIFNLYFLWIFGDNVEDYLGTFCYAQLILFATLMGGTVHVLFDPRPEIACVGASGGISGFSSQRLPIHSKRPLE